jgi:LuxR family transcriptional regulator, maltose regulon positive regulatory protein
MWLEPADHEDLAEIGWSRSSGYAFRMPDVVVDRLGAGRAALARGKWALARAEFQRALAERESPEALEGLGRACWWLDEVGASSGFRERAYRLYREGGDVRGAARLAVQLARLAAVRGERAVFSGWTQRARRLLAGVDECPEHAMLAIHEAFFAFLLASDPVSARARAVQGAELARRFGLIDLEMQALALEGVSLVAEGDVAHGMRLLDEATAAALGGEMREVELIAQTCCFMIYACERVRDFDRAGQWCTRMKEFCQRAGLSALFAVCRTHYATVLTEQGEWGGAEAELLGAREQLALRPGQAAEAIARLGELRRRQARFEEAAALFGQVAFHPRAQIGHAALALDLGDPEAASGWAERFLRQIPEADRTQRAHGFELLARARAALGDLDGAREAITELTRAAEATDSELLHAAVALARGVVEMAAGAPERARGLIEDAVDRYERGLLPFEAAAARTELADVLRRLGQGKAADTEARRATWALERLGAVATVPRAKTLGPGGLSARELDVLRLVAQGLGDREIARRLVLSPHTVHRHVSNILMKTGLSSRAAAAAAAARQGWV